MESNPASSVNQPAVSQHVNDPSTNGWDAFEHFLMFATLYIVSISLALVLYSLIDEWVPGLSSDLNRFNLGLNSYQIDSLRWYLTFFIVSYPFFAFFFLNITKKAMANPKIRNIDIRSGLSYITLGITFLIMFYNVLYTVYSFLNGNIYLNFILHLLTTLGISGLIFIYFAYQVMEDRRING